MPPNHAAGKGTLFEDDICRLTTHSFGLLALNSLSPLQLPYPLVGIFTPFGSYSQNILSRSNFDIQMAQYSAHLEHRPVIGLTGNVNAIPRCLTSKMIYLD